MGDVILRERHDKVEVITLNRPAEGNTLTRELYEALDAALVELGFDESVGAVVLTGAGEDFSLGAEGTDIRSNFLPSRQKFYMFNMRGGIRIADTLRKLPKPVIAAVNGRAIMGGLEMALACDFIVASTAASLGDCHPAGVPGGGGSQRLLDAVGARTARWMIYTGALLPAGRAHQLGLVQQLFEPQAFLQDCVSLANDIVARSMGQSLRRVKSLLSFNEPSEARIALEVGNCVDHYCDPQVQQELERWAASVGR